MARICKQNRHVVKLEIVTSEAVARADVLLYLDDAVKLMPKEAKVGFERKYTTDIEVSVHENV